jgi:hypothetical protein
MMKGGHFKNYVEIWIRVVTDPKAPTTSDTLIAARRTQLWGADATPWNIESTAMRT